MRAKRPSDFREPVRVRRELLVRNDNRVRLRGDFANCRLAVGGGVSNVARRRANEVREMLAQGLDDRMRIIDRIGRLDCVGRRLPPVEWEAFDVANAFHDEGIYARDVSQRPFDLRMTFVTNKDELATGPLVPLDFAMDLRNKRADGVVGNVATPFRLRGNRG